MAAKTFTAPLALIKADGIVVGTAKNIRVTENYRRGRVTGIGTIRASEVPIMEFTGSGSMSFYTIDFNKHPLGINAINRQLDDAQKMEDSLVLNDIGFRLDLLRKREDTRDAFGIIQPKFEIFTSIRNCFINTDGFDLSEGQISGHDTGFEFLDMMVFQK